MGLGGYHSARARAEFDEVYDAGMRALPEPSATRDVPTGFGTVRVYRFGAERGRPVVLLPGRAATTVMWLPNLADFAARHPVYVVDLLGEPGRSEQTRPIDGGADHAAWLDEAMGTLDLREVHLVGYSYGGWLACNQVVRAPGRLASATLIDPVRTFAEYPAKLLGWTLLAALPVVSRWARPAFLRWITDGEEAEAGDPVAAVIDAGMRAYRMATPSPPRFTGAQLRAIDVPVLALLAGRSVMHNVRAAAKKAALVPGIRAEVWPRATHAIAAESAPEVDARVLAFLEEVGR